MNFFFIPDAFYRNYFIIVSSKTNPMFGFWTSIKHRFFKIDTSCFFYFTKSKKNNSFKVYYFECKTESGKLFSCKATMPQESFISEIIFSNEDAKKIKNTKIGFGKPIYFPKSKDFIYVDTSDLLICQQEELSLTNVNTLFNRIKKTGSIDFKKSMLNRSPKPEHWIRFRGNNNEV
ncbi:MAG: hypothetical protein EBZ94_05670, partial [Crocinitomicaceae bacterium]|nr:hypothetical protein [Flavobacteriia bacterium]NDC28804.1 hypothetical protein [Crocinitomicaceae bacterium]NDC93185.1 hypothetical protein [Flavobacteriales bacterium]